MREWAHQRAELLRHYAELNERARHMRDEASARQMDHGVGDRLAKRYQSEAARLDLAATSLLEAVQSVDAKPRSPTVALPDKSLCPMCGGKRHWKERASTRVCQWRQWATAIGVTKRDDPKSALPTETSESSAAFEAWLGAHPDLVAGSTAQERYFRQRDRAQAVAAQRDAK